MSFPKYSRYGDSGVEWLGSIPDHWRVDRFKRSVTAVQNGIWGDEPTGADEDLVCIRVADFDRQRLVVTVERPTKRRIPVKERAGRVLRRGDLLLEKSGGGEGQPVGCVVLYDDSEEAVCSNFVARVCLASGMNPSFWRYVHAAAYAVRLNTRSIKQTSGIQNLDSDQYFDEPAPFPPTEEQDLIAEFLDREIAKIDALVAEQQRLVDLLATKRMTAIAHAVTKGIEPKAEMRPSGVRWTQHVPAHWQTRRLKNLSPSITVGVVVNPSELISDEGLPFIYGGDIREEKIDAVNSRRISAEQSRVNAKTLLHAGDLLTVRVGAPGVTAVVPADCEGGNCASVMLVRSGDFNSYWLMYAMNSPVVRDQVKVVQYGAAQEQFNIAHAVNFWIPTPPRDEQDAIANHLRKECERLDKLSSECARAILVLNERRAALISAAVTGQIDVRGVAETKAA